MSVNFEMSCLIFQINKIHINYEIGAFHFPSFFTSSLLFISLASLFIMMLLWYKATIILKNTIWHLCDMDVKGYSFS